jgi:hypothetical protein
MILLHVPLHVVHKNSLVQCTRQVTKNEKNLKTKNQNYKIIVRQKGALNGRF